MNSYPAETRQVPELSICIPTFNRSKLLAVALASIVQHSHGRNIEVVVCDNASTDDTESMVAGYIEQFPAIRYFKNPLNIGFDRNLLKVLEHATGDYCWTLGSDDAIVAEAIPRILEAIRQQPDIIIGDAVNCDVHLQPTGILKFIDQTAGDLSFQSSADVMLFLQRATMHASFFGYIGAMVYRRQAILQSPPKTSFIGSGYIHVSIALEILLKAGGVLSYLAEPLALARRDNHDDVDGTAGLLRHYIDYQMFRRCLDDYFSGSLEIHNAYKTFVRRIFKLPTQTVQSSGIAFVDQFRECFSETATQLPETRSTHMHQLVLTASRLEKIEGLESLSKTKNLLHIGFRNEYDMLTLPVFPQAIGYDRHYIATFDAIHLPFESASQEVVWASYCFHHFPNLNDAVTEWLRVTKPGGVLILSALVTTDELAPPSSSSDTPIRISQLFNACLALLQSGECCIRHCSQTVPGSYREVVSEVSEIDLVLEKKTHLATSANDAIQIAMQHHQRGELIEAAQSYASILAMEPNHFAAIHMLGVVHFQQGNFVLAERLVKQAIQVNAGVAEAHYNLGCIYQATRNYREARLQFEHSLVLNPEFEPAHARLTELPALQEQA